MTDFLNGLGYADPGVLSSLPDLGALGSEALEDLDDLADLSDSEQMSALAQLSNDELVGVDLMLSGLADADLGADELGSNSPRLQRARRNVRACRCGRRLPMPRPVRWRPRGVALNRVRARRGAVRRAPVVGIADAVTIAPAGALAGLNMDPFAGTVVAPGIGESAELGRRRRRGFGGALRRAARGFTRAVGRVGSAVLQTVAPVAAGAAAAELVRAVAPSAGPSVMPEPAFVPASIVPMRAATNPALPIVAQDSGPAPAVVRDGGAGSGFALDSRTMLLLAGGAMLVFLAARK